MDLNQLEARMSNLVNFLCAAGIMLIIAVAVLLLSALFFGDPSETLVRSALACGALLIVTWAAALFCALWSEN